MKFGRSTVLPALLAVGALTVSACGGGSDQLVSAEDPAAGVDCGGKQELHAGGSTAQANAIEQFAYAYSRACPGKALVYNANGSATGVDDFIANEIDLAGSEVAMDATKSQPERAAERCGSPAWDLPLVFGPIAVTYHINGVNSLNLDGPTLAKIFNGSIGSWDNPAIKALNAGVALPALPIHVVYRSDRSPSTAMFQKYLDVASDGAWYAGGGDMFNGGIGEGATGNNGAAAVLQATDGSITYNEWSFAVGKQLPMAQIVTAAGSAPVAISAESVGKTIAGAKFVSDANPDNDLVLDTASLYRPAEHGAYPIVSATYQMVCSKYPDAATGAAVKAFLQAAIGPGQDRLDQYGFIPLPASFKTRLQTAVNAIS
ncbi:MULTISPECIES: phosphate ABC transporter substrate-binding protein PstS [Mycolicibacter]|uniref:Phosphate-binding protein n=1 Tax=Mycolicibacter virginiensis TaxID=1795032 RepID=A0A9X7IJ22_9MYCO|nr:MULTISPECIES: phosphate ABC transporter substrate-binding protein PstS [Mycobacteriaceae]OBG37817.1 phosphate ABC transporter substrate-binding protein PstS [Mycolicibacter heraklionensis]PQM49940.1 phosphate ABC transporter substrate-binding protein PstS [Mycolicibacter virginiensis]